MSNSTGLPRPSLALVAGLIVCACSQPFDPQAFDADPPRFAGASAPPAIILAAGDIARCGIGGDEATAKTLDSLVQVYPSATVVPLGDLVYPDGTAANFRDCYGPSWGRFKSRSRSVIGNHEYDASPTAQYYWDYMGDKAGPRGKGYYSWDTGSWHIVVLNTNSSYVSTRPGTPQDLWLANDLATHQSECLLGLWHHPRFSSQTTLPLLAPPNYTSYPWERFIAAKGDLILNASQHFYERFAPQRTDGTRDGLGLREFIVGSGGASGVGTLSAIRPNSETRVGNTRGVLKLELGAGFYRWQFVRSSNSGYTDSGSAVCHKALPHSEEPPPPPPPSDPTPPPPSSISLTVKGERRSDGRAYLTLDWTGAIGSTVDLYRNSVKLLTTENDGHYVNSKAWTAPTTYAFRVCASGGAVCSPEVRVTVN